LTCETILAERASSYARSTLNRPRKPNIFTAQVHEEIRDALDHVGDERRRTSEYRRAVVAFLETRARPLEG
jgi:enoyl-CoA hydratase/carnithine racemase